MQRQAPSLKENKYINTSLDELETVFRRSTVACPPYDAVSLENPPMATQSVSLHPPAGELAFMKKSL